MMGSKQLVFERILQTNYYYDIAVLFVSASSECWM